MARRCRPGISARERNPFELFLFTLIPGRQSPGKNGFKASTMRLGVDVFVFTRNGGQDFGRPTQSIGMLSYTFLMETGKQDIVVPMIDFEKRGEE
ncbi:hypothetical protein Tco_1058769 [Tanacetum coccineum]|uniref:Uncharacterized protein n=1 Tax=Tanacetum coccineum TaxID=301880 RepID=A0ABQ5HB20_9ASTR